MKSALPSFGLFAAMVAVVTAAVTAVVVAAEPAPAGTGALWKELLTIVEQRIKRQGLDEDTVQFVSFAEEQAWADREKLFALTRGYLTDRRAETVGSAYALLARLRGFDRSGPVGVVSFEEKNAGFFGSLDQAAVGSLDHAISLHDDAALRGAALYFGSSASPRAGEMLRKIVASAKDKGQALICLAWHRDPADMDFLLPYMLEDTDAASHLPYQFRVAYGEAARPYLLRALSAAGRFTPGEAAEQLKLLNDAASRRNEPLIPQSPTSAG